MNAEEWNTQIWYKLWVQCGDVQRSTRRKALWDLCDMRCLVSDGFQKALKVPSVKNCISECVRRACSQTGTWWAASSPCRRRSESSREIAAAAGDGHIHSHHSSDFTQETSHLLETVSYLYAVPPVLFAGFVLDDLSGVLQGPRVHFVCQRVFVGKC